MDFCQLFCFFSEKNNWYLGCRKELHLTPATLTWCEGGGQWGRTDLCKWPFFQACRLSYRLMILLNICFLEVSLKSCKVSSVQGFCFRELHDCKCDPHTHIGSTNLPSRERNRRAHSASRHFSSNMKRRTCRHATFTRSFYKNGPMHAHIC